MQAEEVKEETSLSMVSPMVVVHLVHNEPLPESSGDTVNVASIPLPEGNVKEYPSFLNQKQFDALKNLHSFKDNSAPASLIDIDFIKHDDHILCLHTGQIFEKSFDFFFLFQSIFFPHSLLSEERKRFFLQMWVCDTFFQRPSEKEKIWKNYIAVSSCLSSIKRTRGTDLQNQSILPTAFLFCNAPLSILTHIWRYDPFKPVLLVSGDSLESAKFFFKDHFLLQRSELDTILTVYIEDFFSEAIPESFTETTFYIEFINILLIAFRKSLGKKLVN